MTTHRLDPGERRYVWWPFWGLPTGVTPSVRVGAGDWQPLEADATFDPGETAPAGAKWFRALLAHPTCVDNPPGTVVTPLGTSKLRHRIVGNPEVEIPDPGEYVAAL